jgi:hypothetical protein
MLSSLVSYPRHFSTHPQRSQFHSEVHAATLSPKIGISPHELTSLIVRAPSTYYLRIIVPYAQMFAWSMALWERTVLRLLRNSEERGRFHGERGDSWMHNEKISI